MLKKKIISGIITITEIESKKVINERQTANVTNKTILAQLNQIHKLNLRLPQKILELLLPLKLLKKPLNL